MIDKFSGISSVSILWLWDTCKLYSSCEIGFKPSILYLKAQMFMLWKEIALKYWVLREKCLGCKFKKRTGMNNKNGERCEHKRQTRQEMQYESNWMEGTTAPLAVTKLFRGRGQIE